MIEVKVFGSGSSGNCYLLDNGIDQLMIETGLPFKKVAPRMNFNFERLRSILISHEHNDHSKYLKQFLERTMASSFMSEGTFNRLFKSESDYENYGQCKFIKNRNKYQIGSFTVQPFDVEHDAAEPLGFLIISGTDRLLYATDTYYVKYHFKNVTQMLVEMNYSVDVLREEIADGIELAAILKNRLYTSHFEMKTSLEFIKANISDKLQQIILIHLSGNNSYPDLFKRKTQELTGIPVYLANELIS
ncbi:MAG: MBL fold metallo-hydrolase [Liquorilactobacillus nagelii]|uniref:MBL fold metallo-hydrolase n=1 Tax=Oenococcus sicerae TaxID=2203724 RepID=UPI0039EB934C